MLSEAAEAALAATQEKAKELGHQQLDPLHLLLSQIDAGGSLGARALQTAPGDLQHLRRSVEAALTQFPKVSPPSTEALQPNHAMQLVMDEAQRLSQELGGEGATAGLSDLLAAGFRHCRELLAGSSYCAEAAEEAVKKLQAAGPASAAGAGGGADVSLLERFGTDLVAAQAAGELEPITGRVEEVQRVIRVLAQSSRSNPILVGEPGVGKTSVVHGLTARILKGAVPDNLRGVKVISVSLGAMFNKASTGAEVAQRFKALLQEVKVAEGRVLLYLDELHVLAGAGKLDRGADLVSLLEPMLARRELQCIGATTLDGYHKCIEKDGVLQRYCQEVHVHEPSVRATVDILRGLRGRFAMQHGIGIQDSALVAAATLADRYIPSHFLPAKAAALVDQASADVVVQLASRPEHLGRLEAKRAALAAEGKALEDAAADQAAPQGRREEVAEELARLDEQLLPLRLQYERERGLLAEIQEAKQTLAILDRKVRTAELRGDLDAIADLRYKEIPSWKKRVHRLEAEKGQAVSLLKDVVTVEDIAGVVARWTGIPVQRLSRTERERLLSLGPTLKARVLGQDEAADAVARTVLISAAGLKNRTRPLGSFLFLGPAGTGKTEMTKAIASSLFCSESSVVHFDLSEFAERRSLARLLGVPPTFAGHEEGGRLTEALRCNPHTVVLFDDLEKAHPDVLDVLMEVLDGGRLTDSHGRTADATNAIFVVTSNLGRAPVLAAARDEGRGLEPAKRQCLATARGSLRPELLSRFDDVVVFNPLMPSVLRSVVRLQLQDVSRRLADFDIELTATDAAVEHALSEAFDPELGARPLGRWLERHVVGAVAEKIVAGELIGGKCANVDFDGQEMRIEVTGFPKVAEDEDMDSVPIQLVDSKSRPGATPCTARSECAHFSPKRPRM